MAYVSKRSSDRARKGGKWTMYWVGEDGKRKARAGFTDRAKSLETARKLEEEAALVRMGLLEPGERKRREAAAAPVLEHIEAYKAGLVAKGDTERHAKHIASVLRRLLADAAVSSVADLAPDRIQDAIGRMRVANLEAKPPKKAASARTCNHAIGAVQAFARWLELNHRIKEAPRGLFLIPDYPEKSDRKRIRRALTTDELARLLEAARTGPTITTRRAGRGGKVVGSLTGAEREILYRIAMATGFRAEEIRTLTPESFNLEGDAPTITVRACYSKRGKRSGRDDVQPIRRDVAEVLRPWLETRAPGKPVLPVPEKTAEMLRADLARAKILDTDTKGRVLDFHALRHSYITHLVRAGVNPKVVQALARHSTITLTLDRYTTLEDGDARAALEGVPTNADHPEL